MVCRLFNACRQRAVPRPDFVSEVYKCIAIAHSVRLGIGHYKDPHVKRPVGRLGNPFKFGRILPRGPFAGERHQAVLHTSTQRIKCMHGEIDDIAYEYARWRLFDG